MSPFWTNITLVLKGVEKFKKNYSKCEVSASWIFEPNFVRSLIFELMSHNNQSGNFFISLTDCLWLSFFSREKQVFRALACASVCACVCVSGLQACVVGVACVRASYLPLTATLLQPSNLHAWCTLCRYAYKRAYTHTHTHTHTRARADNLFSKTFCT